MYLQEEGLGARFQPHLLTWQGPRTPHISDTQTKPVLARAQCQTVGLSCCHISNTKPCKGWCFLFTLALESSEPGEAPRAGWVGTGASPRSAFLPPSFTSPASLHAPSFSSFPPGARCAVCVPQEALWNEAPIREHPRAATPAQQANGDMPSAGRSVCQPCSQCLWGLGQPPRRPALLPCDR